MQIPLDFSLLCGRDFCLLVLGDSQQAGGGEGWGWRLGWRRRCRVIEALSACLTPTSMVSSWWDIHRAPPVLAAVVDELSMPASPDRQTEKLSMCFKCQLLVLVCAGSQCQEFASKAWFSPLKNPETGGKGIDPFVHS